MAPVPDEYYEEKTGPGGRMMQTGQRGKTRVVAPVMFLSLCFTLLTPRQGASLQPSPADPGWPNVFVLEPAALAQMRKSIQSGERRGDPALTLLLKEADRALGQGPFSVIQKPVAPPSGDKHDYMSLSAYYWPNPNTPDGLPYVSRDGEVNPESLQIPDRDSFDRLVSNTQTLALAYFFMGKAAYAEHAARLLRTWFLDPATRMNPHLDWAQILRGHEREGRNPHGSGIIETSDISLVVDSLGLLAGSPAWTAGDQDGMRRWFSEYHDWLLTSEPGRREGRAPNNHGTHYDQQVVSIALLLGRNDLAARVLGEVMTKRIAPQIDPEGRQPLELARTRSWSYSVFNLEGLFRLAHLAGRVNEDLWNAQAADGRGIRQALDWLVPFASGERTWFYKQITKMDMRPMFGLLRQAAAAYRDSRYWELSLRLKDVDASSNRANLLYPKP